MPSRRWLRRGVAVAFAVALAVPLGLVALGRIVPLTGHAVYVIRSGSMTPAIPVGSAVILERVTGTAFRPGDVVTLRLDNGAVFTHRVVRTTEIGGRSYVQTKGDANATQDPSVVPDDHVIGRVVVVLPLIGFLMAFTGTVPGAITAVLAAMTLLLAGWLLDDPSPGTVGATDPGEAPA